MNTKSLTNHLVEHLRGEIAARTEALVWIEAQETALAAHDAEAFENAVQGASQLLQGDDRRSARRAELLGGLARAWDVPVQGLTLGGVARRLGSEGEALEILRLELRQAVATLIKRSRRLAALIGLHRRINTDVCQLVLGCESPEQVESGGALVDAEA